MDVKRDKQKQFKKSSFQGEDFFICLLLAKQNKIMILY